MHDALVLRPLDAGCRADYAQRRAMGRGAPAGSPTATVLQPMRRNGMKVQIMSPAADRVDFTVPPAPRLASLEGKTIGLYNNTTGGADIAVDRVAEHLSRRYPNVTFERYGGVIRPGRPVLSRG